MTVYYFKEDCRNVTEFYYGIILSAVRNKGIPCKELEKCDFKTARTIPKEDYVLATTLKSFIILYLLGRRNFIYWYQGITPEEVFLMSGQKWKYHVNSFIEKLSLKTVKYKIGVSKYLFEHFEEKYKMNIDKASVFIMPCFNSELNEASFKTPGKYEKNVFCYAGGTQAWQGFDEILRIYGEIEKKRDDVFLKIFSKDMDTAKRMIEKVHLKHYSVGCVPQSEMDNALADCKFGFIIREDSIINNVATPTKLGTYLANGVIPIFSSTIHSFRDLAQQYDYLCCVENGEDVASQITSFMENTFYSVDVYNEYKRLFSDHYNTKSYVSKLEQFISVS